MKVYRMRASCCERVRKTSRYRSGSIQGKALPIGNCQMPMLAPWRFE